jgi:hypothetical protein
MSEDVIGKLARFTPTAPGLNRDELLFRAGRASAPSGRWWKLAVAVLAVAQIGTVAAWMTQKPTVPPAVVPVAQPAAVEPEPEPFEPPPRNSYLILSRIDPDEPYRPDDAGLTTPTKPKRPLTAGWRGGPID